jgi:hypothetical protein
MSVSTFQLRILLFAILVVVIGHVVAVLKDRLASASYAYHGALTTNHSFGLWAPFDGGPSDLNISGNTSSPPSIIGLRAHWVH